jgi:opacity protein-like surface antigen
MLKRVAAGLVGVLLAASPAVAGNVSGWYAGIYAGASSPNDVAFGYDEYFFAQLFGPGSVETPSSYVNDGGIDPRFFDFLNLGPEEYPFADSGISEALLVDGTLQLRGGPIMGVVVGYGFGNGLRIEGDLSATGFAAGRYTYDSLLAQAAEGTIDGSGVWTWTNVDELEGPLPPSLPLADIGFIYRTDVQFLLANAFFDIETGTALTPYLGAGLGAARVTAVLDDLCGCISGGTQVRLVPAAQLGGGMRIAISDPVSLDIGYRFKLAASPDFHYIDTRFDGFGGYDASAVSQSGVIGVHTLQAGLIFALQ